MTKRQLAIGDLFVKAGERRPRPWRVQRLLDLADGPHAQLVRIDDPSRTITLAINAILDPRLMSRIEVSNGGA